MAYRPKKYGPLVFFRASVFELNFFNLLFIRSFRKCFCLSANFCSTVQFTIPFRYLAILKFFIIVHNCIIIETLFSWKEKLFPGYYFSHLTEWEWMSVKLFNFDTNASEWVSACVHSKFTFLWKSSTKENKRENEKQFPL